MDYSGRKSGQVGAEGRAAVSGPGRPAVTRRARRDGRNSGPDPPSARADLLMARKPTEATTRPRLYTFRIITGYALKQVLCWVCSAHDQGWRLVATALGSRACRHASPDTTRATHTRRTPCARAGGVRSRRCWQRPSSGSPRAVTTTETTAATPAKS